MFSRSGMQFLQASLQRTREALQHTIYDVTETLAEIQGKTEVKRALEVVREQNHARHRQNLWQTAYHNRGFIQEDMQTIRDITWGVMGCVKMGVEKGAETAKILQEKLEAAIEKSQRAKDIKAAIIETIEDDFGLGLVREGLATQKEALLETIRSLLDGEVDARPIRYFLDEETMDLSDFTPVSRPSLKEKMQQTMEYVVQRSQADSRHLAQWCENILYDGVETHSQEAHARLSQALATARGQNGHRNHRNCLQETAEAVSTIREGWQALAGVFASQQMAMGR